MRKLLAVLTVLGALFLPRVVLANACASNANGLWSATTTWTSCGGVVPVAADDVTINHSVILDSAAACAGGASACGRTLNITANASVILGRGTTFLWMNCSTATNPCINISGTLIGGPGQTLKVGSDGGGGTVNPDRITVNAAGRLSWQGRMLQKGTITSVTQDEATVTNTNLAFGLPTRDIEFEDAAAHFPLTTAGAQLWANSAACLDNCYVVRFTSGDRAWRWYNTIAASANLTQRIKAEFQSHHNPARDATTLGIGIAASTSKADGYGSAYTTGTAAVSGQTVTGTGTAWTTNIALGSRWFCTSDTQSAAKRIVRVVSATSLILESAYGGAGCAAAAAYTIVDDNQPYPFFDHSEHVKVGDTYDIIQPATIQGATITTGAEPNGSAAAPFTNIECVLGSSCNFKYTQFKWLGGFPGGDDRDVGLLLREVDNNIISDCEFKGFATSYGIDIKGPDNIEIARNFIHYFAPALGGVGIGHGMVMEDSNQPPALHVGNYIHDNRFELTNDDAIWARSPQSGIRITRNIFKYIGATTQSESANCVDVLGYAGVNETPPGLYYDKDFQITDNICENYGSALTGTGDGILIGYGSAAGFTFRAVGSLGGPGYRMDVGITRNLVANGQTGSGIAFEGMTQTQDTLAEFLNSTFTVAGNYITNVAGDGADGTNVLNNFINAWGLDRQATAGGGIPAIGGPAKNIKGNIAVPVDEPITTPTWPSADTIRAGIAFPSQFINPSNGAGYPPNVTVTDNVLFGHSVVVFIGDTGGSDFFGNPFINLTNNYLSCELSRTTTANSIGIDQWRGTNAGQNSGTWTYNIISGCQNSNINLRGFANAPFAVESNNLLINSATAVAGFSSGCLGSGNPKACCTGVGTGTCTFDATDSLSSNLGWSPLSFSYDRRNDITDAHGPRSVGILMNQSWHTAFSPQLSGTVAANFKDSDGDGVADLFDNCPKLTNPTQLDSYGNGVGDACR